MIKLIDDIRAEKTQLEKKYTAQLQEAIKEQLELLHEDRITFSATALCNEYNDHFNFIEKDGSTVVYNNADCDTSGVASDDANVASEYWSLEMQIEILEILSGYNKANPKPKMVRQVIPQVQMEIVQRGLNLLEKALQEQDPKREDDNIGFTLFDIVTLRGMLKGEVAVVHPKKIADAFSFTYGVDFPEYSGFPKEEL